MPPVVGELPVTIETHPYHQPHRRDTHVLTSLAPVLAILWLCTLWTSAQSPPEDKPTATTQPAVVDSDEPEPPVEPSATDILRELSKPTDAPPRPVIPPTRPGPVVRRTVVSPDALPANAVAPVSRRLLPDGYRLVDRPGRLTREGEYYVYAFESRGRGEVEPPIRLLPNRLLEDMESFSAGGTKPVVFLVSGEVTEYHGVNYLLVQKLLTRPDVGNLK
jgi:hypothetical protein